MPLDTAEMNTKGKASKLVRYVRNLDGFRIVDEIDGDYNHIGATVADAILQANMRYETHVRPRVARILSAFPEAATVSGLRHLLSSIGVDTFLDWKGEDRIKRFEDVVALLTSEGIETERDLKDWLRHKGNLAKLEEIRGIGPKTVDYLKILTGLQTSAIDRHLINFLDDAGVPATGYREASAIFNLAADEMEVPRSHFDHSVWTYMSEKRNGARHGNGNPPCPSTE